MEPDRYRVYGLRPDRRYITSMTDRSAAEQYARRLAIGSADIYTDGTEVWLGNRPVYGAWMMGNRLVDVTDVPCCPGSPT